MNTVAYLLKHNFSSASHEDKIKIKGLGRPTPDINLEVSGFSRQRTYKRQFNNSVYTKTKWLCGCDEKNALFCFPCLLFTGDKAWTVTGVTDLSHLTQSIKRHELTKKHLKNEVNLALYGNVHFSRQLDPAYWNNIKRHNERVTKNRSVLARIIDCIKFCGAFELALQGHDEAEDSSDPGVFRGLVNFSADIDIDNVLRDHLQQGGAFKGTSKEIQNDLLQCMLEVCREKIATEVNDSNFLAVMADEATDVASKFQMVVVLRYVKSGSGNPVERFWGFINPEQHDAASLTACIRSVIDPFLQNNPKKLVAQAYDGAAVMSGNQVQAKIQEEYPLAYFVHCYAHQLNLILSQAVSQNTQVRVFFSNVEDVIDFFSNLPKGVDILSELVEKREPHAMQKQWNFKTRAVNIIYEHKASLIECMQEIQEQFTNAKVLNQASSIERMLLDKNFLFWLNIFHNMPHSDVLYDQLQTRHTDPKTIRNAIITYEKCIENIRDDIEEIIRKGQDQYRNDDIASTSKRRHISEDTLRASAVEVCDVIIRTIKSRFEYTHHLLSSTLFSCECFDEYRLNFPEAIFLITTTAYPVFDIDRLRIELSVIYCRPEFRDTNGAVAFLNMLKGNGLEDAFKETAKLLEIIITIPMTTEETERCFSTLKRIKAFLRNTMSEDRLTALSMISIENSLVKSDPDFNERVIEKFATMKPRPDLIYKK